MKRIGLTGGIGSGKSTVAGILRSHGLPVLDADAVSREVMAPGQPAYLAITATLPGVLDVNGEIDRKALAKIMFADPPTREAVESVVHPQIMSRWLEWAAAREVEGKQAVFFEAALLVETGLQKEFDELWVVAASESVQIKRVMARNNATEAEAHARVAAQFPLEEKVKLATKVIQNDGDLDSLKLAVSTAIGVGQVNQE